jgi:glycosyltransferase involved in cell wall biosynthesis
MTRNETQPQTHTTAAPWVPSVQPEGVNILDPDCPVAPAELLTVLPLVIRVVDGRVFFELQARDSLIRILKWFKTVILAGPRLPEERVGDVDVKSIVWVPVDELRDRVQFVPLPPDGGMSSFLRGYRPTVRRLRRCIDAAQYIECSLGGNGGLNGDWAAVTAEEAIKKGRKFALVSDIVCDQAYEFLAAESRGLTRLKWRVKARLIRAWQRRLIARCELMHCNGMDTYQACAPLCRSPDIAIKFHGLEIGPEQLMPPDLVEAKWRDAASRRDLRVCYAGRAEPKKAPIDWVRAIGEAKRLGADIKAVWMGDGSIFPAMQAEVERLGLSGIIELTGFVSDRDQVIRRIRESDVMLFTHIEPESPRVLIEALMSACPIVGYERLHPANLISVHGGGELTPLGDWQAAGAALARLVTDRDHLAELIQRAYRDSARFDSEVIVRDRCAAIRERLS